MTRPTVNIQVLEDSYAVCRMKPDRQLTLPGASPSIYSVTRTPAELSIVCASHLAPEDAEVEEGWSAMVVEGPLDFSLTGILASIADPLASAEISIFAVSTYDTDYVLLKSHQRDAAVRTLEAAGHTVGR
ncbi:MAG: ACT domain-containing protein [Actinomycetota bacterium]|nr:ACT domain-containing protein [Actinomycetota bacterium]